MYKPFPTSAEIIAAYETTGLKPRRYRIDPRPGKPEAGIHAETGYCCAIGALATQAGAHTENGESLYTWADETYGEAIAGYIIAGFDESQWERSNTLRHCSPNAEEFAAYNAARLASRTLLGFEPFEA